MAEFRFVSPFSFTARRPSPALLVTPQRQCCTTTCTSGRPSTWATRGCTRTRCGCERPSPERDSEDAKGRGSGANLWPVWMEHSRRWMVLNGGCFGQRLFFFLSVQQETCKILRGEILIFSHFRTILQSCLVGCHQPRGDVEQHRLIGRPAPDCFTSSF